ARVTFSGSGAASLSSVSGPDSTGLTTAVFTAPATVNAQLQVVVVATSVADPTKSASVTLTLQPTVSLTVNPATVTLSNGQTQQFTANFTGTTNSAVLWAISPSVGTISTTGLYTAPPSFSGSQKVTVTATSLADPTKTGTATITLNVTLD